MKAYLLVTGDHHEGRGDDRTVLVPDELNIKKAAEEFHKEFPSRCKKHGNEEDYANDDRDYECEGCSEAEETAFTAFREKYGSVGGWWCQEFATWLIAEKGAVSVKSPRKFTISQGG